MSQPSYYLFYTKIEEYILESNCASLQAHWFLEVLVGQKEKLENLFNILWASVIYANSY